MRKRSDRFLSASHHDKIRAPVQARSKAAMDRILDTLEALLKEKAFDSITLQELAQRSDTGTSSIYARFKDKQAMMIGIQGRLRDRWVDCIEELTRPARWERMSDRQLITGVVLAAFQFYEDHGPLVRAMLLADEPAINQRVKQNLKATANRFAELLGHRGAAMSNELNNAVNASCLIVVAAMHSDLLIGALGCSKARAHRRKLIEPLVIAINAILHEALAHEPSAQHSAAG